LNWYIKLSYKGNSSIGFIDNPLYNSNNKTNIAILGIIVNHIVTWVGVSS